MAFNLIQSLNNKKTHKDENVSIMYQQYVIETNLKQKIVVNIPVRETDNFENRLSDFSDITYEDIKQLLRTFRGLLVD